MGVGERIRAFAKARYRTQVKFSEAVGMAEAAISNLVNERQMPGPETLTKFAAVGMNLNWLLTGEGDMNAAASTYPQSFPVSVVHEPSEIPLPPQALSEADATAIALAAMNPLRAPIDLLKRLRENHNEQVALWELIAEYVPELKS